MGAKEIMAKISTKYGTVTEGKHSGTQVALGNDPNGEKVSTSYSALMFEQIIFVEGSEEKGRYNILEDFDDMTVIKSTPDNMLVNLAFKSGENAVIDVGTEKESKGIMGYIRKFNEIMQPTPPEKKRERKYYYLVNFLKVMYVLMDVETLMAVADYFQSVDVYTDELKKFWNEAIKQQSAGNAKEKRGELRDQEHAEGKEKAKDAAKQMAVTAVVGVVSEAQEQNERAVQMKPADETETYYYFKDGSIICVSHKTSNSNAAKNAMLKACGKTNDMILSYTPTKPNNSQKYTTFDGKDCH